MKTIGVIATLLFANRNGGLLAKVGVIFGINIWNKKTFSIHLHEGKAIKEGHKKIMNLHSCIETPFRSRVVIFNLIKIFLKNYVLNIYNK